MKTPKAAGPNPEGQMAKTLQPDPSMIGGVPEAPFALTPEPQAMFEKRAKRFAFLAQNDEMLAPYLKFLADLTAI